jgi:hypothetical protein
VEPDLGDAPLPPSEESELAGGGDALRGVAAAGARYVGAG